VCLNLGRTEEAVGIQKRALKISLDNGDYANAASASTNLALIVGRQGRMDEAINLLKSSLAYLEKKPHPNTEIITRLALIQALGAEQREPELAVNVARELFKRFSDKLRPDQRNAVTGPLKNIIRRHPELEPEEWKRENSPWGYGG
jgi:tetratricopeptide (TPR) repeat protein